MYSEIDAREMLKGIERLVSVKSKKLVSISLKRDRPTWAELRLLMLGPTGNLRAPVIRKGKTLVIGFNSDLYLDQLV